LIFISLKIQGEDLAIGIAGDISGGKRLEEKFRRKNGEVG